MQMDVSIVIVNWNTKDILRNCLFSVYKQTNDITFEVVVIDNASSDGSAQMVKDEFPQVILIENSTNKGFAAANNQGMKISQGRYILLLNSDTVVLDEAIPKTLCFAEQHTEAAVTGCKVLNPDHSLQPTCFKFPSAINLFLSATYLYKIFPKNHFWGRERMTWWDRNDVRKVDVVTGCFMLVRQEAIERVGLMDEDYFMYAEETDWCWRFKKAGWTNLFYPGAEIIHIGGQSSKQVKVTMMIQLRRAILQFMKKNYGKCHFYIGRILVLIFFILRIPFWLIVSLYPKEHRRAIDMVSAYSRGCCIILSGREMSSNYFIITPAFNEALHIGRTIEGVLSQTVKPLMWIIVDDGSTDQTADIVKRYAVDHLWIQYVYREKKAGQSYYSSNVYAIQKGLSEIQNYIYKIQNYNYMAILDADISLPIDYYEKILTRMALDTKLGIASGIYIDRMGENNFQKNLNDRRSTPKALMVFRRECFEDIGGFIPMKYGGEDTCACFMARMKAWKTWSFPDVVAIHNKPIGTGHAKGILKIRFRQGKAEYFLASPLLFVFAKCFRRCFKESPFMLSGIMRLGGYLYAFCFIKEKRQIPQELVQYIRKELNQRLLSMNSIPNSFRG